MTVFLELPFTTLELTKLIAWRQYYDIIFVSNLANAAGNDILSEVWTGQPLQRNRPSASPPRCPPRRGLDLALWQRALLPLVRSSQNHQLRAPLGLWATPVPPEWMWSYSPANDRVVYQRVGALWQHYRRTGLRVNRRLHHGTFSSLTGWCTDLPTDLHRADIRRN
jgi:hypothetical protein